MRSVRSMPEESDEMKGDEERSRKNEEAQVGSVGVSREENGRGHEDGGHKGRALH